MTIGTFPARVAHAGATSRARVIDVRLGGVLLTVAGASILMGIITAEALYPGAYATGANEVSDLGGTRPPDSVVYQPSAAIFNLSMVGVGIMVILAAWFAHRAFGRRSVSIPIAILGIGALGVGLFPGNTGNPHAVFAMVTFIAGGVAAISAARTASGPFRWVSTALGAVSLLTLVTYMVLGDGTPMAALGIGGIERWIVYPVILWLVAFGGYLSGLADGHGEVSGQHGE